MSPYTRENYYPVVMLSKGSIAQGVKCAKVHVLVLEAFVGPRPAGYDACHDNGNKRDNRLTNLRWDTRSNNVKQRAAKGERHPSSKLTEKQVIAIRASKDGLAKMSAKYAVSLATVSNVRNRKVWKHI